MRKCKNGAKVQWCKGGMVQRWKGAKVERCKGGMVQKCKSEMVLGGKVRNKLFLWKGKF